MNDPFYDEGVFLIPSCEGGTCRFQNAGEAAYGDVDLRLALTYSSDVYFYNLAASFDILPGFDLESVQVAAKVLATEAERALHLQVKGVAESQPQPHGEMHIVRTQMHSLRSVANRGHFKYINRAGGCLGDSTSNR